MLEASSRRSLNPSWRKKGFFCFPYNNKPCITYQYYSLFSLSVFLPVYDNLLLHTVACSSSFPWAGARRIQHQQDSGKVWLPARIPGAEGAGDLATLRREASIFGVKTPQSHTRHSCNSYHHHSRSCSPGGFPVQGPTFLLPFSHARRRRASGEPCFHLTAHVLLQSKAKLRQTGTTAHTGSRGGRRTPNTATSWSTALFLKHRDVNGTRDRYQDLVLLVPRFFIRCKMVEKSASYLSG